MSEYPDIATHLLAFTSKRFFCKSYYYILFIADTRNMVG